MKKIIIIKLSSLGDILHSFPVPYLIRKHIKDAEIHWVAEKCYHDMICLNDCVDFVHSVEIRALKRKPVNIFKEIGSLKELRKMSFEYSFDLQGNLKSGVVSLIINAEKRVGFDRKNCREPVNSLFNNKKIAIEDENSHVVLKNIRQLEILGIRDDEIAFPVELSRASTQNIREYIRAISALKRPLIGISPFAGFETKMLPLITWKEVLVGIMHDYSDANIILFWGPGEFEIIKNFHEGFSEGYRKRIVMMPASSIIESFAIIDLFDLFLASDTGPLHIADSLGKKVIGIYTCTSPDKNGPFNNMDNTISSRAECSPCYKRHCPLPVSACRTSISAGDILNKIRAVL